MPDDDVQIPAPGPGDAKVQNIGVGIAPGPPVAVALQIATDQGALVLLLEPEIAEGVSGALAQRAELVRAMRAGAELAKPLIVPGS